LERATSGSEGRQRAVGCLSSRAESENGQAPIAAEEADFEPRLIDQARLFSFSAEVNLVGRPEPKALVRSLAVEPLRVARQIPVDGLEGAIDEEPPRVLGLQGPPEPLDPGRGHLPPDGAETPADAVAAEEAGETAGGERDVPVGNHPRGPAPAMDGLADEGAGYRSRGRGAGPDREHLAGEAVDDRADPDGAKEAAHPGEVDEDHVEGAFRLK